MREMIPFFKFNLEYDNKKGPSVTHNLDHLWSIEDNSHYSTSLSFSFSISLSHAFMHAGTHAHTQGKVCMCMCVGGAIQKYSSENSDFSQYLLIFRSKGCNLKVQSYLLFWDFTVLMLQIFIFFLSNMVSTPWFRNSYLKVRFSRDIVQSDSSQIHKLHKGKLSLCV